MKLSIITVNLNNRDGLQRTIDSVICQSFRDYEWIVIDGGSTDGSKELIEQYAEHFSYWVSEPDKGIYNAMNKGIKVANGEYCLFLNSGDSLFKASTMEDVFSKERYEDLFWGRMLYCVSEDRKFETGMRGLDFSAFELFQRSLPHQACFIKRDVLVSNGMYDESYKIVSDLKFFYNSVMNKQYSMAYVDTIVSVMDGNGISSDLGGNKEEEDRLFCEFYPNRLLKDYHNWLQLKEENVKYKNQEQYYHNAMVLYDFVKKHPAMRKLHTMFYKIAMKLMS